MTEIEPQQASVLYGDENKRGDANSVTALRILDVLYALLAAQDPKAFEKLVDLHSSGGIMGPVIRYDDSKMLDQGEE